MNGLAIRGLTVRYGNGQSALTAVDDVDLVIPPGEVLGVVGESGSGKSSIARALVGLAPVVAGRVELDGRDLLESPAIALRGGVQLIFQDPYGSLNPRMTVGESLSEGIRAGGHIARGAQDTEVDRLLDLVELDATVARVRPRALSGGQRQRVAIARALGARPQLLIADEITSALDVSVQGAVLNLLRNLQRQLGFSVLLISHNLAVVRYLADTVAVMYCARVVETAAVDSLIGSPQHPYTQALVAAVPGTRRPDDVPKAHTVALGDADPADPRSPPTGCRFHPRCPIGPLVRPDHTVCRTTDPGVDSGTRAHRVACFFPETIAAPNDERDV